MPIRFSIFANCTSKILILLLFILFATTAHSLENNHHHAYSKNEIGIGVGGSYNLGHKEWGTATHLHYARKLSAHSNWHLISGLEYVKADENHFTVEAGLSYLLFDKLTIGAMPGITFNDSKSEKSSFGSIHFEVMYALFTIDKFHFGPVFDYTLSKYEKHITIGLHTGFCF